jgi:DNA-binding transcriptional LysR family regulator
VHVTQVYTTPDLYNGLRDRSVDFVIGRLLRGTLEKDLDAQILFDEPTLVVAGAKNPWARRRKIDLADLIAERWILPRTNTAVGMLIAETFHASGLVVPRPAVVANSIHMNNVLLASGHFLTMHPRSLVKLSTGWPSIKVLPVVTKPQRGPVGIVTLKSRMVSPVTRLVIDCIREVAKPLARTK